MSQELIDAITGLRQDDAVRILNQRLEAGAGPMILLAETRQAMDIIGKAFEEGDCFIPELILAGEIMYQISQALKPRLGSRSGRPTLGKVVIGTVDGDLHDTPKSIVAYILEANGFEVTDLGADVPPERFVQAARETGAGVVALSGFLTQSHDSMKATVTALKTAGLNVKVMVGGGSVDEQVRLKAGADAYGKDAYDALRIAKNWSGG